MEKHRALESKMIKEAGPWHGILHNLFREMEKGDNHNINTTKSALRKMKKEVPYDCWKEYMHIYSNILTILQSRTEYDRALKSLKARG